MLRSILLLAQVDANNDHAVVLLDESHYRPDAFPTCNPTLRYAAFILVD
jgi:hypothetical protein